MALESFDIPIKGDGFKNGDYLLDHIGLPLDNKCPSTPSLCNICPSTASLCNILLVYQKHLPFHRFSRRPKPYYTLSP